MKILLVEDNRNLALNISDYLESKGYITDYAADGITALSLALSETYDVIVLDIMLPGMDGLSVCQQLKTDPLTRDIPIIIVSAKEEESDVVIGLGLGAADYVAKPFSPRELMARVKAVLRRAPVREEQSKDRIVIRDLLIDNVRHEVRVEDKLLQLTATEFRILYQLALQPGRAFTREQLLNRVVGEGVVVVDRNIDVHIRSVRKKLGPCQDMIQTIRGVGYRFLDG